MLFLLLLFFVVVLLFCCFFKHSSQFSTDQHQAVHKCCLLTWEGLAYINVLLFFYKVSLLYNSLVSLHSCVFIQEYLALNSYVLFMQLLAFLGLV